jgi:ATP-binding cassette subfamily F protein 3
MLVVSHDRYLIDKLATEVWLVDGGSLQRHEGNWSSLQKERATAPASTRMAVPVKPPEPVHAPAPSRRKARSTTAGRASRQLSSLEVRIAEAEERLRQLEQRISEVAASGNYMETRRVGDEHASLERALRELYDEWTAKSEEA